MEIPNCMDDFLELLLFSPLVILAEVFLCFVLSWDLLAIIVCVILDIFLIVNYLMDWIYLSRKIILDQHGCSFVSKTGIKSCSWNEIYLQYVENTSFLFGDFEIPGNGIILSTKPLSKPTYIGAMTYCRFNNPSGSAFIRFVTAPDNVKRKAAKFVYRGFTANEYDLLSFLNTQSIRINR